MKQKSSGWIKSLAIGIGFWPALQKVYTVHNTSRFTQCQHSTILDYPHTARNTDYCCQLNCLVYCCLSVRPSYCHVWVSQPVALSLPMMIFCRRVLETLQEARFFIWNFKKISRGDTLDPSRGRGHMVYTPIMLMLRSMDLKVRLIWELATLTVLLCSQQTCSILQYLITMCISP